MHVPWRPFGADARWRPIALIVSLAILGVYVSLLSYQQIDGYLFPGNELQLGRLPVAVPGTNIGVNVSVPGVTKEEPPAWTRNDQLNVLVMGIDRRPFETEDDPARSDTMFVMSIDKQSGKVQLLAIPRDLWAYVPMSATPGEWGAAKINAAFAYGILYGYPGGGPAAAVAAIQHNYHINIDHYVVIDWDGFVRLIDAVGGIEVDVPEAMSDPATDVLQSFPNGIVQAGPQHMNGEQALSYSRVRVDGDIKRIERQQIVIRAVARQALSLGLVGKLPELWDSYKSAIRTDVDNGLVPGFALLARRMDLKEIETFSLGPAVYSGISDDGQLILLPNFDQVYAIIDQFLADPRSRAEAPAIVVEHAPGLAAEGQAVVDHLAAYGIPPQWVQVVEGTPTGPGIVEVTKKPYTAEKLAALLDLPKQSLSDAAPPPAGDLLIQVTAPVTLKLP